MLNRKFEFELINDLTVTLISRQITVHPTENWYKFTWVVRTALSRISFPPQQFARCRTYKTLALLSPTQIVTTNNNGKSSFFSLFMCLIVGKYYIIMINWLENDNVVQWNIDFVGSERGCMYTMKFTVLLGSLENLPAFEWANAQRENLLYYVKPLKTVR